MALPTAPTYSIGVKGVMASGGSFNAAKTHIIPDTTDSGNALPNPAICYGGYQQAMAQGDTFLFKNLDGRIRRGRFDAERSTPTNPVVIPV